MGTRGEMIKYHKDKNFKVDKFLVINVDKRVRDLLKGKMDITLESNTDQLHVTSSHVHQLQNEHAKKDAEIQDFFKLVDWSQYKNKGNQVATKGTTVHVIKDSTKIIDFDVTEQDKAEIASRTGIFLDSTTRVVHLLGNSIYEYDSGGSKSHTIEDFFNALDWTKYENFGEPMNTKAIALITKGFDSTKNPIYSQIKELGKMNENYVSSQEYLIFQDGKYFFTQDPLYQYDKVYTVKEFEEFLQACEVEKNASDIIFLLDISTIKDEHHERYKKLFRISPTFKKEQILDNSFIRYVNGEITFHAADMGTKKEFEKEFPGGKIYLSINENDMYYALGKYVPSIFEEGKTYIVRSWDDMEAEYGLNDGKINNKNLFPKENKKHSGKTFTTKMKEKSFRIDSNAIFPEETYEVNTMAKGTIYTASATGNGAKATNIFTDEVIPEPVKPPKPKVTKVGKKYYQGNKEVSLADFAVEVEIDEKEVNEKRFVAAIELGVEYDNLEEKSKRIQDIIKNELDSPEAIADKEWVYIYGASGSGKTTEAIKYFNDKGQDYIKQAGFGQLTGDDLLGYKSITEGTYFRSLLRDAVEYGKGFILDEADACNPNTLLVLNELKGEYMQFPDKKVKIHEDFRFIATGNTIGFSEDYNGRSKMDRATTARFSMVEYNLTLLDIGERWGGSYTKRIKNLESKEPREIQREIRQMKQKEGKTNA